MKTVKHENSSGSVITLFFLCTSLIILYWISLLFIVVIHVTIRLKWLLFSLWLSFSSFCLCRYWHQLNLHPKNNKDFLRLNIRTVFFYSVQQTQLLKICGLKRLCGIISFGHFARDPPPPPSSVRWKNKPAWIKSNSPILQMQDDWIRFTFPIAAAKRISLEWSSRVLAVIGNTENWRSPNKHHEAGR